MNFTMAAKVLYVTQPSLSKQIALLEDELGVILFDRKPRDLQLTSAGKLLYYECKKLMPLIDDITERVKRIDKKKHDTLFIGCAEAIHLGETASNAVRDFTSRAPDTEVFIERHGFEALHNKIIDGSIDVAFTLSSDIVKMKDILYTDLEQRNRYIIMSAKHRLASRDEIGIGDLRGETFVLYSKTDPMMLCDDILKECGKLGFFPGIHYALDADALLDYLELVGGVAFFDKSITENRPGRLKYFPVGMEKRFSLVCVWKKDNRNPALREFVKCLPGGSV